MSYHIRLKCHYDFVNIRPSFFVLIKQKRISLNPSHNQRLLIWTRWSWLWERNERGRGKKTNVRKTSRPPTTYHSPPTTERGSVPCLFILIERYWPETILQYFPLVYKKGRLTVRHIYTIDGPLRSDWAETDGQHDYYNKNIIKVDFKYMLLRLRRSRNHS